MISVVPPPISISATPSSRSSGNSAASADASGSKTISERRHARALAALGEILSVALRRGDDMNSRLEPHARHSDWIAHALLLIDRELLRQNMQHLAIERDRDRARRVDHAIDIARADFAAAHRDDSVAVEPADMRPGDADDDRADAHAGGFLRFLDRRCESPRPSPRY